MRTSSTYGSTSHAGIVSGGDCLALSMGGISALHEHQHSASRDLFDTAKRMDDTVLSGKSGAEPMYLQLPMVSDAPPTQERSSHNTPIWLSQAILPNVF